MPFQSNSSQQKTFTLESFTKLWYAIAFSLLTEAGKTKNQATKFAFNLRGSFFLLVSFEATHTHSKAMYLGNGVEIFLPRKFCSS